MIEELQNQRDAVGKHQVLGHVLKLKQQRHQHAPGATRLSVLPPRTEASAGRWIRTSVQSSGSVKAKASALQGWGAALPNHGWWVEDGRPGRYLVDVVQLEVLEQQQQDGGDGLHNDLLVAVHIHAQLHALQHRGAETQRPVSPQLAQRPPRGSQEPGLLSLLWAKAPTPPTVGISGQARGSPARSQAQQFSS